MKLRALVLLAVGALMVAQYQNCAQTNFEQALAAEKVQALSEQPIFPETPPFPNPSSTTTTLSPTTTIKNATTLTTILSSTTTLNTTTTLSTSKTSTTKLDNGKPVGSTTTTTNTTAISPKPMSIKVTTLCSTNQSENFGGNVMYSHSLKLVLKDTNSTSAICTETDTNLIRSKLSQLKQLYFSNCNAQSGSYKISLLDHRNQDILVRGETEFSPSVTLSRGTSVAATTSPQIDQVLMDFNPSRPSLLGIYKGSSCDQTASPLYIDMREDSTDTDFLSSPQTGVWFDIMGANAEPVPYQKFRISWFQKGRFAMVTLPNEKGEVLGIDQLFGNNTKGADGRFASNGFLALAKYDLNQDNYIDTKDAVFNKLRLWFDRDRNGVAADHELVSLKEGKITSIDLKYDPNFHEIDQYGNEIKFKSIVYRSNGRPKPIFDVWFILK